MPHPSSQLSVLPISVHGQAVSRLSQADLLQFECMLATADDSIDACMNARTERTGGRWLYEADDATAAGILQSVLDTISALTGEQTPIIQTRQSAVAWVSQSVLGLRDRAVDAAAQGNLATGMNPSMVSACMELITKLNTTIGANPGP